MKIRIFVVMIVFIFVSVMMAAEYSNKIESKENDIVESNIAKKNRIVVDLRKKKYDEICQKIIEYGEVEPIERGPHVWAGKRVAWCAENFVRVDGWQLSGWSKVTLDREFNMRRVKIGLISPELYANGILRMHEERARWDEFSCWKEMHVEPVFGVCISWEF